jgi:hypothetical protein
LTESAVVPYSLDMEVTADSVGTGVYTAEELAAINGRLRDGVALHKIATELGVSDSTLTQRLALMGLRVAKRWELVPIAPAALPEVSIQ